jgi:hypothetical protein
MKGVRWTGQVARMGQMRKHSVFRLENLKGRYLGRPCRRCEDNIRIGLREMEGGRCGLNSSGSG